MKRIIGAIGIVFGIISLATLSASAASVTPVAKAPTMADVQAQICDQMQTQIDRVTAQLGPNSFNVKLLTDQRNAYCPAKAVVTISANGCVVTAQGPKGAVITYGAYTADRGRGFDAEPITITDATKTFTGYTGATSMFTVYVTVTKDGKQLATKTIPVTVGICSEGQLANGGYPAKWANVPQDSQIDNWGMYNRESASYAAFKVADSGRYMPYWGGRGNPKQWPANARAAGIPVDTTPRVGDVAISTAGTYSHAIYVEAVNPDGTIGISQYNANLDGKYSTAIRPATGLQFIHF